MLVAHARSLGLYGMLTAEKISSVGLRDEDSVTLTSQGRSGCEIDIFDSPRSQHLVRDSMTMFAPQSQLEPCV
jgi:hypothetical protein